MRQKKAKMLRRLAKQFASVQKLPALDYDVLQHTKKVLVDPVLPAEVAEAQRLGTTKIVRVMESFQTVLADCQRRVYQIMKNKYKTVGWR